MAHTLNQIMSKIDMANEKLCNSENNLQYIKALKSMRFWLLRLSMFQNSKEYEMYFFTYCGFSTWDRVNNSILDYQYGNKPF